MPKITITDIDKMEANIGQYQNFSVVVPGFVDPTKEAAFNAKADANGVLECSSKALLEECVGAVSSIAVERTFVKAKAFAPVNFETEADRAAAVTAGYIAGYSSKLSELDFWRVYGGTSDEGVVYTGTKITDEDRIADFESSSGTIGANVLKVAGDTTEYYDLTKVPSTGSWNANTYYVIMLANGTNKVASFNCVGNGCQIAHELVGKGYTVLYKKLSANSDLGDSGFYEALLDKSTYDFRFILSGVDKVDSGAGVAYSAIAAAVANVADTRGDCIALVDVDASIYDSPTYTQATPSVKLQQIATKVNALPSSENVAIFTPSVTYADLGSSASFNGNVTLPASFHYLTCFFNAQRSGYAEWFAAAGYTRGVSAFSIAKAATDLGDVAANALEPRTNVNDLGLTRACNIIAKFRKTYLLWGNRTAAPLDTELTGKHFLNIRQLVDSIKKQLYTSCRKLTFDPNTDVLWNNFRRAITPTLDAMKGNQGIRDYELVYVASKKLATLEAKIRIEPIEAVEDFEIEILLENSLGSTSVSTQE